MRCQCLLSRPLQNYMSHFASKREGVPWDMGPSCDVGVRECCAARDTTARGGRTFHTFHSTCRPGTAAHRSTKTTASARCPHPARPAAVVCHRRSRASTARRRMVHSACVLSAQIVRQLNSIHSTQLLTAVPREHHVGDRYQRDRWSRRKGGGCRAATLTRGCAACSLWAKCA